MEKLDAYGCREAFGRIDDYVDRELTAEEIRLVREHLEVCAVCSLEFSFEAQLLEDVRERLQRLAVPPDLKARVLSSLRGNPPPPER